MIEDVNPYLIKMLGYSREEFIEKKLWEVGAFRDIESNKDAFESLLENEYIRYEDLPLKTKDGRLVQVEFVSNVYMVDDEKVIQCNIRDITERKQAEQKLARSEKEFRNLVENAPVGIFRTNVKGDLLFANDSLSQMLGFDSTLALMQVGASLLYKNPTDRIMVLDILQKESRINNHELEVFTKNGDTRNILLNATAEQDILSGMVMDITERKQAGKRIQRQLEHLTALSAIDRVIAANFDLKLSLSEILVHVTKELGIDAADILIFNSNSQMLEFGAEYGFRTKVVGKAQIRLGESYAGRAALERQLIQIPNLKDETENLFQTNTLKEEDFVCYYGVPLITKGQVKGVLEVFHRTTLEPDAEWLDFLIALAGQAAIAIENATLFESLQRSNSELALAYDATIEGWSHALDLRDKETEGHSKRVTEMAVILARAFGLTEPELVQVRWGALLHDIGKMGVPDGILHKPGPLTDEEWASMKMHPTFAYDLLSLIRYLRLALDIPHYHHEKWDGTGYPDGLKGVQIPLVARIFAVVDVWDALNSNRPYRPAWTEEEVREHIRASSGTHFDPQVVSVFMQMPS